MLTNIIQCYSNVKSTFFACLVDYLGLLGYPMTITMLTLQGRLHTVQTKKKVSSRERVRQQIANRDRQRQI